MCAYNLKGMSNGPVKENNFLEQFDNVQEYFFKAKSNIEQSLYSLFKDEIGADKKNWVNYRYVMNLFIYFHFSLMMHLQMNYSTSSKWLQITILH